MPMVQAAVSEFFGKRPHKGVNPDEVVAMGAAIQASVLASDDRDLLLLDVTPFALGIATFDGHFAKLIERNTTVPARKSHIFTTTRDDQSAVKIRVLQGDSDIGGRQPSARRVRAGRHPEGAEGRAGDRGRLRHRRQRHRERLGARPRHGQGAVHHRERHRNPLRRGDRADHARERDLRSADEGSVGTGMTAGSVSLLDFLDAPVLVGDPDGRVVYVNSAFEACSGIAARGREGPAARRASSTAAGARRCCAPSRACARSGSRCGSGCGWDAVGYAALASPIKSNESSVGVVILLSEELEQRSPRARAPPRDPRAPRRDRALPDRAVGGHRRAAGGPLPPGSGRRRARARAPCGSTPRRSRTSSTARSRAPGRFRACGRARLV